MLNEDEQSLSIKLDAILAIVLVLLSCSTNLRISAIDGGVLLLERAQSNLDGLPK